MITSRFTTFLGIFASLCVNPVLMLYFLNDTFIIHSEKIANDTTMTLHKIQTPALYTVFHSVQCINISA